MFNYSVCNKVEAEFFKVFTDNSGLLWLRSYCTLIFNWQHSAILFLFYWTHILALASVWLIGYSECVADMKIFKLIKLWFFDSMQAAASHCAQRDIQAEKVLACVSIICFRLDADLKGASSWQLCARMIISIADSHSNNEVKIWIN